MKTLSMIPPPETPLRNLGLLGQSTLLPRFLEEDLPIESHTERQGSGVNHTIGGQTYRMMQPLTFTPFISVAPCSARCRFCSETLIPRGVSTLSSGLRPKVTYFDALAQALAELRGLPLGLSLSGLEATDDHRWLAQLLDVLDDHRRNGGVFTNRVLYTNGNGLTRPRAGAHLLERLTSFDITRVEISRHHFDAHRNASIMRFRPSMPAGEEALFEDAVRNTRTALPTRLVCVVQRGGVDTGEEMRRYLSWADGLGVDTVVFRELARLGDLYEPNAPRRYVDTHRVAIETLLQALWPKDSASRGTRDLVPQALTAGYYYWSFHARWRDRLGVIFETSDYGEMKRLHHSDRVYKLVFHANENLCADWDPCSRVLRSYGENGACSSEAHP